MKFNLLIPQIAAFFLLLLSCQQKPVEVVLLSPENENNVDIQAIYHFLQQDERFLPDIMRLPQDSARSALNLSAVYWLHLSDTSEYAEWNGNPMNLSFLKKIYGRGGILLSGYAALLPYRMGIETAPPEVKKVNIEDDWSFDQRGLQSWQGHAVFNGLFGGCFLWDACQNHTLTRIGYFDDRFPLKGKVAAVEKSFITIHPKSKLLVEYGEKDKRLLAMGAFVRFDLKNHLRYKLEHFLRNALLYLSDRLTADNNTYWQPVSHNPQPFYPAVSLRPNDPQPFIAKQSSGMLIEKARADNNFFDLAGRRILIMGQENGGIDEVWVHPFRLLRDFRTGLIRGDSVLWLDTFTPRIEIRPESLTRYYDTPAGRLKEIVFPSLSDPAMTVRYELTDTDSVRLFMRLRSDLRWMWPYDEHALGAVYYGYDKKQDALHIKDKNGRFYVLFGSRSRPALHLTGAYKNIHFRAGKLAGDTTALNQVYHAAVYTVKNELQITIAGSDQGIGDTRPAFRRMQAYPALEYNRLAGHYRNLIEQSLTFQSPDAEFNRLWKWTLVGIDRFFTHTPGLGGALVAGFATTDRGWDGRHKISGRPGYAWYFGRDAAWSAFAIADYGDFGIVRRQLEFFQKFQDESGKIFHELSTSGVVHYDAADATPLYVILAAYYLRASGDLEFIRQSWPHIRMAMDYLYSTDTDGDGLIENTNEGHGWVEGGKLWGAHTTFYLAGLWARALSDAAELARHLHYNALQERYLSDHQAVISKLEQDFWNPQEKFFYYGKRADGSYNSEKTVLPATALYFNRLNAAKAEATLRPYAGNGFSADWGVRILSSASPLFNPRGYHYGSVWPLFTGWAALAEYAYGRPLQGFTHITNNMFIKNHWAAGFVEEVMNGAVYQPSGVCPHQCWSETNIAHPAISGMLGWRPDAMRHSALLRPAIPPQWDSLRVSNLRVGNSRLRFFMERTEGSTLFRFELLQGPPLRLKLSPWFPPGTRIVSVRSDKQPVSGVYPNARGLLPEPIAFVLDSEQTISFEHNGGITMLPELPRPRPGETSQGYRIVNQRIEDNRFIVDLEGKANTAHIFRLKTAADLLHSIEGAEEIVRESDNLVSFKVLFPAGKKDFSRKKVVALIRE